MLYFESSTEDWKNVYIRDEMTWHKDTSTCTSRHNEPTSSQVHNNSPFG